MADDEGGGKPAEMLGKDPKKRKVVAIGIGIAALLFVFMYMRKSSSSSGSTPAPTTTQPIADVTVPSDQQSSSDLTAQWATMQQATMQELSSMLALQEQGQPGAPPAQSYVPAQAGTYTVTGRTNPTDIYPQGAVIAIYGLSPADYTNIAYDSVQLQAENPGQIPPWTVGTVLKVPQITTNERLFNTAPTPATPTGNATSQPLIQATGTPVTQTVGHA